MQKENFILCGLFGTFLVILACGYNDSGYEVIYQTEDEKNPVAFTDDDINKSCFGASCHNSQAPNIPLVGEGFKASKKVRDRIENGSMPPANKWSAKDVKAAIEYLNSN